MARKVGDAVVDVRPDVDEQNFGRNLDRQLDRGRSRTEASARRHGRLFGAAYVKGTIGPFRTLAGTIGGPVAAAFAALGIAKFGKDSIAAFSEAQQAQLRLSDAFARFPKLAHANIDEYRKLNTALALKTRFDDDALASGQAILAQFRLTGKQLLDVTPLLADYAAKTGKDIPTAAKLIGRASLGNARALKDLGINFKATGDQSKDMATVIALLSQRVGGFAEKEGKSAAGRSEILKNQFGELQETVGSFLLPAFLSVTGFITQRFIPAAQNLAHELGPRLTPIVTAISQWITQSLVPAIKTMAAFIATQVLPAVQKWVGILATALQPALKALGQVWEQNIRPALKGLFGAVQRNWPAFQRLATIIITVAGFILKTLLPPLLRLAGILAGNVIRQITLTINIVGLLIRWLITAGKAVGDFAVAAARHFVRWYQAARDAVGNVIEFFRRLPGRITNAVGNLGDTLYNKGKAVVTGFWDGVKAVWNNVIGWFKELPSKILDALGIGSPPQWAIDAGRDIMGGILKGVVPGGKDLLNFAKSTVGRLTAGIGTLFGEGVTGTRTFARGAVALGKQLAAQLYGWTGGQWDALFQLWQNESGWNPMAKNPSSSAFGIPQFIAGTARAYGVFGDTNAMHQIVAGLKYISNTYGSPMRAWGAWLQRNPHWYRFGGWINEPVMGIGRSGRMYGFGEAGPERVTPAYRTGIDVHDLSDRTIRKLAVELAQVMLGAIASNNTQTARRAELLAGGG